MDKPDSRRYRWRRQMIKDGKCGTCGKPRDRYADRCNDCGEKNLEMQRLLRGNKPWRPGGRGRPPLLSKREA